MLPTFLFLKSKTCFRGRRIKVEPQESRVRIFFPKPSQLVRPLLRLRHGQGQARVASFSLQTASPELDRQLEQFGRLAHRQHPEAAQADGQDVVELNEPRVVVVADSFSEQENEAKIIGLLFFLRSSAHFLIHLSFFAP